MTYRILHTLSQRPSRTGSGITLDAMVRLAATAGYEQSALVGVPVDDDAVRVGELPDSAIERVNFAPGGDGRTGAAADLDFPVPGMSDVMPYASSVWSTLDPGRLATYRSVWRSKLAATLQRRRPHLIHGHHVWLLSSLLRDLAPDVPIVVTCHATGLRQMELCPHLADEVSEGCRSIDHFCVLHREHEDQLTDRLGIDRDRVTVIGAGYRDEVFRQEPTPDDGTRSDRIVYVGKYSAAKGLPWLLEAFEILRADRPGLELHVAGSGSGTEATALKNRMESLGPQVVLHGALDQPALARLMNTCGVCVLPSFYEGVPLVLVEAAACGCRLVCTDLPGVREQIWPTLKDRLELVSPPRLRRVDQPDPADLPRFVQDLVAALDRALRSDQPSVDTAVLGPFTWGSVFERVEGIWQGLLDA